MTEMVTDGIMVHWTGSVDGKFMVSLFRGNGLVMLRR